MQPRRTGLLRDVRGAVYVETLVVLPVFVVLMGCLLFANQSYKSAIGTGAANRAAAWSYVMDGCQGNGPAGSESRETHEGLGVAALGRLLGMIDRIRSVFPSPVRRLFPKLNFSEREFTRSTAVRAPTAAGGGEITVGHDIVLMCNEERGPGNMLEVFRGSSLAHVGDVVRTLHAKIARARQRALAVLRLLSFAAVALSALLVIAGRHANAQVSELMMGLGTELLRYEGAEFQDRPRTLRLNGESMKFASGTAPHSLEQVLDHYEHLCDRRDGQLGEQIERLLDRNAQLGQPTSGIASATLREEAEHQGFVACLDMGEGQVESEDLIERFARFSRSMDLSDLGELRYVYGEESDGATHFVTFWTEGSFSIARMFPAEGDAPGFDLNGVPRPPNGRRILSTREEGQPQSMAMYVGSDANAGELEQYYHRALSEAGWSIMETGRTGRWVPREHGRLVVAERGEAMISIVLEDGSGQGGTATLFASR